MCANALFYTTQTITTTNDHKDMKRKHFITLNYLRALRFMFINN